jgi:hypothetical protein
MMQAGIARQPPGQFHARLPRHLDIEQQHVKTLRTKQHPGLGRVGRFVHYGLRSFGQLGEQAAQAAAGQRFVVNDEHVHSGKRNRARQRARPSSTTSP